MGNQCGNCDCADKSQCEKKNDSKNQIVDVGNVNVHGQAPDHSNWYSPDSLSNIFSGSGDHSAGGEKGKRQGTDNRCSPKSNQVKPGRSTLKLSEQDILDIIKVTSTEVDIRLSKSDIIKQTAGVVDTILNRAVLNSLSIRQVINAKNQFSAISGNKKAYGSVQAMPQSHIKPIVQTAVMSHLQERANGADSVVQGHVNYLNPKVSSAFSLKQWGNAVVESAKHSGLVFGKEPYAHYHGTAPGGKQAPAFNVNIPEKYFESTCPE